MTPGPTCGRRWASASRPRAAPTPETPDTAESRPGDMGTWGCCPGGRTVKTEMRVQSLGRAAEDHRAVPSTGLRPQHRAPSLAQGGLSLSSVRKRFLPGGRRGSERPAPGGSQAGSRFLGCGEPGAASSLVPRFPGLLLRSPAAPGPGEPVGGGHLCPWGQQSPTLSPVSSGERGGTVPGAHSGLSSRRTPRPALHLP